MTGVRTLLVIAIAVCSFVSFKMFLEITKTIGAANTNGYNGEKRTHKKGNPDEFISEEGPKSDLFPKRLVTVFGLEKSGTTWTHDTICKAFGMTMATPGKEFGIFCESEDGSVIVQHISQPWGFYPPNKIKDTCSPTNAGKVQDLPVIVPKQCFKHRFLFTKETKEPEKCKAEAGLDEIVNLPPRFNVNITSHINWYLERGVDATAVVLMRDNNIAHISKTNIICQNATISHEENDHANEITRHAIEHLPPERLVLVSFEGLVSLKMPYLKRIYRQLGIGDSTYVPEFKDANKKYIDMNLLNF